MEWTPEKIVLAVLGSGGFITGIVMAFNAIAARLDARRKRLEEAELKRIADAVELKRLEAITGEKSSETLIQNLWKIIESKNVEIEGLKQEINECEKKATLDRPVINQVYAKLRAMRREIESLNVMVLNEEETNVFMRRFNTVKALVEETEGLLP